jgi:hypothetical protein
MVASRGIDEGQQGNGQPFPNGSSLSHEFWLRHLLPGDHRCLTMLIIISPIIYALGGAFAYFSGWFSTYLDSPAFGVGALGVAWVLSSIRNRSRTVDRIYTNVSDAFDLTPFSGYENFIVREFKSITRFRWHFVTGLPFMFTFMAAGGLAFYQPPFEVFGIHVDSLRPWLFSAALYDPPALAWKIILVEIFAGLIGFCMGMGVWMMAREVVTVARLKQFPNPPLPEIVKSRLRQLADLHLRAAGDWGFGAILFLILFAATADAVSLALLILISLVCAAMFVIPQMLLARIVRNSWDRACSIADQARASLTESYTSNRSIDQLANLAQMTVKPRFWVYSTEEFWRWMVAQGLALGAVAAQIIFTQVS